MHLFSIVKNVYPFSIQNFSSRLLSDRPRMTQLLICSNPDKSVTLYTFCSTYNSEKNVRFVLYCCLNVYLTYFPYFYLYP